MQGYVLDYVFKYKECYESYILLCASVLRRGGGFHYNRDIWIFKTRSHASGNTRRIRPDIPYTSLTLDFIKLRLTHSTTSGRSEGTLTG